MNVHFRVVELQKEHLRHDQAGAAVVDHSLQEDDSVLEQAAKDIEDPLFAAAAFNYVRNQGHGISLQAKPSPGEDIGNRGWVR